MLEQRVVGDEGLCLTSLSTSEDTPSWQERCIARCETRSSARSVTLCFKGEVATSASWPTPSLKVAVVGSVEQLGSFYFK